MPRRGKVIKRVPPPDSKYNSVELARFTNKVMQKGKKSKAEKIIYEALDIIGKQTKQNPIDVFKQALKNATPVLAVRPRRIGGATYQVPVEVKESRGRSLATRWLIQAARSRKGKSMAERLATEMVDAFQGQGTAIKRRSDVHRMAEANKVFAHYRW